MSDKEYAVQLSNVRKGQTFYECEGGKNAELIALEDAHPVDEPHKQGYTCRVEHEGREVELFEAYNAGGYGLRLYNFPIYSMGEWLTHRRG